jgi:hypothetical protein
VPSDSVQPMKGSGRAQDILEAMRLGLRKREASGVDCASGSRGKLGGCQSISR